MWKRIIAALLIIAGIGLFGTSLYITRQVDEGKIKVEKAEKTIKKGDQLFSLTPVTQEVGKGVTDAARQKIDEGKDLIAHYAAIAQQLKIVGIVCAIAGIALFFVSKPCKR